MRKAALPLTISGFATETSLNIRRLREEVYRRFGEVNAQSDAVPFETGPLRVDDMAARDRISTLAGNSGQLLSPPGSVAPVPAVCPQRIKVAVLHRLRG